MRIEPNISVRPVGSPKLGTRTEIKNLNSFRALERARGLRDRAPERAAATQGEPVVQETRGLGRGRAGVTCSQRSKEEPTITATSPSRICRRWWSSRPGSSRCAVALPELPAARLQPLPGAVRAERLRRRRADRRAGRGGLLRSRRVRAAPQVTPKMVANWITGDLFGLLNQAGVGIEACADHTRKRWRRCCAWWPQGEINQNTAKNVLGEMFESGQRAPAQIVAERGLRQISDAAAIAGLVQRRAGGEPGRGGGLPGRQRDAVQAGCSAR